MIDSPTEGMAPAFKAAKRRKAPPKPPEPDYLRQNDLLKSAVDRRRWFKICANEARTKGCTWLRYTVHPTIKGLCLVEGWKTRPEDEGEPRFQLEAK